MALIAEALEFEYADNSVNDVDNALLAFVKVNDRVDIVAFKVATLVLILELNVEMDATSAMSSLVSLPISELKNVLLSLTVLLIAFALVNTMFAKPNAVLVTDEDVFMIPLTLLKLLFENVVRPSMLANALL